MSCGTLFYDFGRGEGACSLYRVMGRHQVPAICSMLSFLLLFSTRLPIGFAKRKGSSSFCGTQKISSPFRLEDDPARCGAGGYRLICDRSNKTVWCADSNRYYVTNISYEHQTISLVDSRLANGCSCCLPSRSPWPLEAYTDDSNVGTVASIMYDLFDPLLKWATFVNCTSQKIKNDMYWPIPCLSQQHDTFVYAVVGEESYELQYVEPSCRFLATVPMASTPEMDSMTDVFKILQKGFVLSWMTSDYQCLRELRSSLQDLKYDGLPTKILYGYGSCLYFLPCIVAQYTLSYPHHIGDVLPILTGIMEFLITLAILSRLVLAPLVIYFFIAYKFWSTRTSIDTVEKFLRNQQTLVPTRYSYTDIIAITSHFREKLGQGGFGSVFKGKLLAGHPVAIKMLGNSKCNGEEFISEVSTIGRIHHVNIVQLVGFSSEGSRRALVYEYMPNGSLDKYIFSSNGSKHRPSNFTWDKLNQIALGVARGIDYLHRGCDMQILHFDIKPQNILLDHNFIPKIADFGLAKLYPRNCDLVSMSAIGGTIGYIAPELISRNFGVISDKSDVYNFGMLLLEMAGGRRNVDQRVENSSQIYYPSWIYDQLAQGEELKINNSIEISVGDAERKLCMVGLWCIQMKSSSRPSMSEVVQMLEGDVDSLQMPPRPCFSSSQPIYIRQSFMDSSLTELSIISERDELC